MTDGTHTRRSNMLHKARKGITPVVAIVLLLMMTVAVAGGAYAWMQGIIGGTQEEASFAANTQLSFVGLDCEKQVYANVNTTLVDFTLKNQGSTTLQRENVDVFMRPIAADTLLGSTQLSNSDPFNPGDLWSDTANVTLTEDASVGNNYEVEFQFTDENSYPIAKSCQLGNSTL